MAKKQKGKVFWITLDKADAPYSSNRIYVWAFATPPVQTETGLFESGRGEWAFRFCRQDFEQLTGITLQPGERIKARLVTG